MRHALCGVVLTACMFALGCSGMTTVARDQQHDQPNIRQQFLNKNPNSPFTENIRNGEVVVGMGFAEVLAAWGLPESRVRDRDPKVEHWSFVTLDPESMDRVQHTLRFEDKKVSEWYINRRINPGVVWIPESGSALIPPVANEPAAASRR